MRTGRDDPETDCDCVSSKSWLSGSVARENWLSGTLCSSASVALSGGFPGYVSRRVARQQSVNMHCLAGTLLGMFDYYDNGCFKMLNLPGTCPKSFQFSKSLAHGWSGPVKPDQLAFVKSTLLCVAVIISFLRSLSGLGGLTDLFVCHAHEAP